MVESNDIVITVDNVSKTFRLPHERNNSIKSAAVNFYRRNKSYEEQEVLRNVSLQIKRGEFFGIVGRNGSGKSTMLKLLAGIYYPSKGAIDVKGKLTPFIELGVGFNAELTGRENVFLNGALLGFSRSEMLAMYDEIVAFAELKKFMDQKLKNYSSGMQVRLAFSIAIKAQSDILLIDEVLAVGDARFQQKCFDYFYELKSSNRTVVFISHDMDSVQRFCDRAILIENGDVVASGNTQDVVDKYKELNFEPPAEEKADEKAEESAPEKPAEPEKPKIATGTKIKITSDLKLKSGEPLRLSFYYQLLSERKVELRLAIVKDGVGFAHINTRNMNLPTKPGKYQQDLELSTEYFMDGQHEIYCGVFDVKNEEQLDFRSKAASFLITNPDPNLYGFTRLKGSWLENSEEK
jgi:ABC-2 type transport system ATP-binding protein